MSFPCDKCGLCCQKISSLEALSSFDRGDGVCKHYIAETGCRIYHGRPIYCRVDEGYEVFASDKMTLVEYYQRNLQICSDLKEANSIKLGSKNE